MLTLNQNKFAIVVKVMMLYQAVQYSNNYIKKVSLKDTHTQDMDKKVYYGASFTSIVWFFVKKIYCEFTSIHTFQ